MFEIWPLNPVRAWSSIKAITEAKETLSFEFSPEEFLKGIVIVFSRQHLNFSTSVSYSLSWHIGWQPLHSFEVELSDFTETSSLQITKPVKKLPRSLNGVKLLVFWEQITCLEWTKRATQHNTDLESLLMRHQRRTF